jgi:hypothetical protein
VRRNSLPNPSEKTIVSIGTVPDYIFRMDDIEKLEREIASAMASPDIQGSPRGDLSLMELLR